MMDTDSSSHEHSALWRALQRLTTDSGVEREDLLDALQGELRELGRCWGVILNQGDALGNERVLELAKRTIRTNLAVHFDRLTPPRSVPRQKYMVALHVSYNVRHDNEYACLKDADLTERRKWLAKQAPEDLRMSPRTSDRYLRHALDQIEHQILEAGYEPIRADPDQDSSPARCLDETVDVAGSEVLALATGNQPSANDRTDAAAQTSAVPNNPAIPDVEPTPGLVPFWQRRRARVLGVAAAVLVVAAAVAVPVTLTSLGGGSPTAVSSNAGPVHIGAIAYQRDGSSPAGWSFVFPQKMQFSTSDLATLNKLNGNGASYVSWVLSKGGVNPNDARLSIDLRNNGRTAVTVTDVQVVKKCRAPLNGTLLYSPPAGGASDLNLAVDLDKQFPVVQAYQDGRPSGSYFGQTSNGHHIDLAPNEDATLLLDATTSRYYCEFSFKLLVDTGSGTVTEVVDDHGKPFKVTAVIGGDATTPQFRSYGTVYGGGVASPAGNGLFVRADPATYQGHY